MLNPSMVEEEAINFASFHIEGDALEWWHHGMVSQGYAYITMFKEFIRWLVKRFNQKKENDYFKYLNLLRQTEIVEELVIDF